MITSIICTYPWASFFTTLIGLCGLVYYWFTKNHGKFEAKGLFSFKPHWLFGNNADFIMMRTSFVESYNNVYNKFKAHGKKYGIHYEVREPVLFVCDPDLAKQIFIRDFDHFMDLGFFPAPIMYMEANDFGLGSKTGEEWKSLKSLVSPAFSLSNLKHASKVMNEIALNVVKRLSKESKVKDEILVEDVIRGYAMDCITQVAFSIKIDAVNNPDNEFSKHFKSLTSMWRMSLAALLPEVMRLFNICAFDNETMKYFTNVGMSIIENRDKDNIQLDDVIGTMMKIRDKGFDFKEVDQFGLKNVKRAKLTNHVIAKTIMQFFLDGYDTVTGYITLMIYFLAMNQDVQEKAIAEIDDFADKHEDDLNGDNVNELKYLEQVFCETGRMCGLPMTARVCTKPWTIPDTDVTIPKGMRVFVPTYSMQLDEKYFPEPEKFRPDRFSPENKSQIPSGVYMPFGIGPRQCMGFRIARMEAKVLLYELLRHFRVEPCSKTLEKVKWKKDDFMKLEGGCFLRFVERA